MVDCPEEECCELRRGSLNVLESGEDLVFMRVQDPSFRTDMFFSNNQSRRLSPRASCGCRGSHRVLWALKSPKIIESAEDGISVRFKLVLTCDLDGGQ